MKSSARGNRIDWSYNRPPVGNSMNAKVLRLLDANGNRAREALRTMEDYSRFILDDDNLCGQLKQIRHDLAAATQNWMAEAILHRDTPGDVGTLIKTETELKRDGVGAVVIAAGKRLCEALRAMEEFSKTVSAADAAALEAIRYRFYTIEQAIARTLKPSNRFESVRLYVLITESACRLSWLETAQAAIRGGADALQLREKNLESGELLRRAKILADLCRKNGVLLIINDRPDIAVLSDADGVHVGQGDLPAIEARKIVGNEKFVGVSTHQISQAKQAVMDGADYIGVGPIFRSSTKPRDWEKIPGLEYAKQVASEIKLPAIGIAGIHASNVDQVFGTGLRSVAVTVAVTDCDDVEAAAKLLKVVPLAPRSAGVHPGKAGG